MGDVSILSQLESYLSLTNQRETVIASNVANAVASVKNALTNVSQQRVVYAGVVNQINAQESYLSQETVSLTSQQQSLTGIDMSVAISNMTQAEIAHSTILAAAAKVLPTSLLDYLN